MAGNALKIIECEACGETTAELKKRGNSKLLYVNCKNPECKHLNNTSAPAIQKKWQALLADPLTADTNPEWQPTKQTQAANGAELVAKMQSEITEEEAEKIRNEKLNNLKNAGLVLLAIGLTVIGIKTR